MNLGTKSVLFGAHCFFLHPWFVALAWWKLYGFPWDPRLWVAFFVHDLGYWGKVKMDDEEGEKHVLLGARIMGILFDPVMDSAWKSPDGFMHNWESVAEDNKWSHFCLYHSRFYAKKHGKPHSRLCVADKAAIYLTPSWLYLPMVNLTGEIKEYMAMSKCNGNTTEIPKTQRAWHEDMCNYVRAWVTEHQDGRADTWTPATRAA